MLRAMLEFGRYLLVLPVIGSLILTAAVVVMGMGLIVVRALRNAMTDTPSSARPVNASAAAAMVCPGKLTCPAVTCPAVHHIANAVARPMTGGGTLGRNA